VPVLYLTEQGSVLRKQGRTLLVEKDGSQLAELELHRVEAVMIFGNVQVTTQALRALLDGGVETAFLTLNGRLKGRLVPPQAKNVGLRLNQYRTSVDPHRSLEAAKAVVAAKLENARAVLDRYLSNYPRAPIKPQRNRLADLLSRVRRARDQAALNGLEGAAAASYFEAFPAMCRGELSFSGRSVRPPTDPMNALLSFGYVLLAAELTSLVDARGLDPYIGFYHQPAHGRPALALDLLEELRHPVVDRLALYLNNNRILKQKHFQPDAERPGGVLLTDSARKRFFLEYERWMKTPWSSSQGTASPRQIIRRQVEALVHAFTQDVPYTPFRFEA